MIIGSGYPDCGDRFYFALKSFASIFLNDFCLHNQYPFTYLD